MLDLAIFAYLARLGGLKQVVQAGEHLGFKPGVGTKNWESFIIFYILILFLFINFDFKHFFLVYYPRTWS